MAQKVRIMTAAEVEFETYVNPSGSWRADQGHYEESARSIYELLYRAVPGPIHDMVRNLLVSEGLSARRYETPSQNKVQGWNDDLGNTRPEDGFPDTTFQIWLAEREACTQARRWVGDRTFRDVYRDVTGADISMVTWLIDTLQLRRPFSAEMLNSDEYVAAMKARYSYEMLKDRMELMEGR